MVLLCHNALEVWTAILNNRYISNAKFKEQGYEKDTKDRDTERGCKNVNLGSEICFLWKWSDRYKQRGTAAIYYTPLVV